jgi:para-nitrobenzyl esterase
MTHGVALRDPLDIDVKGGRVRGIQAGMVHSWRGIPYAASPIGHLRFRAPAPAPSWTGTLDGSRYGTVAAQASWQALGGMVASARSGEDCLTINVQAPADVVDGPLPVMVFIHGGGYSAGSSQDFSGQGEGFVLAGPVVYVSFNYRLGALGYLDFTRYSTAHRPFESNLGLRDQVAALRWVHDNIRAFGGDPENVTVFGESAGGNAVTTLLATPTAAGLFARVIAQSAPPNAVYLPATTARWAAEFVAILRERLHRRDAVHAARARDPADALLAHASVADLVEAAVVLQVRTPDAYPGAFCLAPVVDGEFLPEHPMAAIRAGRAHRVPIIIGNNAREGSLFRGRIDIIPRTPHRIAAVFEHAPQASRAPMRAAYPGLPSARIAADFGGDYGFWFPSARLADFHSEFAPVHMYRFDFAPRLLKLVGLDATHGTEMFALFGKLDEPIARTMTALGGREEYARAGARMRAFWLHFARSGELPKSWPLYRTDGRRVFVIDATDHVESDPFHARRLAWGAFFPELGSGDEPAVEPTSQPDR